jgi:hypothetical protein
MTNTTKYILLGGVALVGAYVGLRVLQSRSAPATSSSGITGSLSTLINQARGISFGSTTKASTAQTTARTAQTQDGGGLPYGPGASDGYAAVSDATGVRAMRSYIPAQQSHLSDSQAAIAGYLS